MCKLVPYWGLSPQPGSTYYLQKLNHDIFGIVNHAQNSSSVYLFDERVGPKNTDHTISYLCDYFSKLLRGYVVSIYSWTAAEADLFDLLFSRIAQTYNKSDVFCTQELKDVIALYADVTIDDGSIVCDWRNAMTKYSKLPAASAVCTILSLLKIPLPIPSLLR